MKKARFSMRWLFLLPYLAISLVIWIRRAALYPHVPSFFRQTVIGDLLPDFVLAAIVVTGFFMPLYVSEKS